MNSLPIAQELGRASEKFLDVIFSTAYFPQLAKAGCLDNTGGITAEGLYRI
jgi:hypothetical protein